MKEARLDISVELPGRTWLLDVAIVSAYSIDPNLERARAKRDGAAALTAEDKKRARYPGTNIVPIIVEAHGRMGSTGLAWLRRAYHKDPDKLQQLLRMLNASVQSHTASMSLAACNPSRQGAAHA